MQERFDVPDWVIWLLITFFTAAVAAAAACAWWAMQNVPGLSEL